MLLRAGRRCLVVTDGFYEWRKGDKQPFAMPGQTI
jgi:putative SOS response-associated peptidase YedK